MQRFITLVVLASAAAVAAFVMLVSERTGARADDTPLIAEFGSVDRVNGAAARTSEALRQQYLERLKARAALMSDEEIRAALESTNSEIRIMEAQRRLNDVGATLAQIAQEYQGTPAAAVADDMLGVYRQAATPVKPTPSRAVDVLPTY